MGRSRVDGKKWTVRKRVLGPARFVRMTVVDW